LAIIVAAVACHNSVLLQGFVCYDDAIFEDNGHRLRALQSAHPEDVGGRS
jgi:hypothetical protein